MAVSVMLKPSSSACNLKCKYCFYSNVSSERAEFFKGMMSDETAENVISKALSFADSSQVYFTFQGGEPLLRGVDFFKRFVSKVKALNIKNSPVTLCVQTNGTLIDDEWCRFFKDNNVLVGVSLDGDEKLNSYRVYPDGKIRLTILCAESHYWINTVLITIYYLFLHHALRKMFAVHIVF